MSWWISLSLFRCNDGYCDIENIQEYRRTPRQYGDTFGNLTLSYQHSHNCNMFSSLSLACQKLSHVRNGSVACVIWISTTMTRNVWTVEQKKLWGNPWLSYEGNGGVEYVESTISQAEKVATTRSVLVIRKMKHSPKYKKIWMTSLIIFVIQIIVSELHAWYCVIALYVYPLSWFIGVLMRLFG